MGKMKKLVLGGLIAGTLMASAGPVLADSPWWGAPESRAFKPLRATFGLCPPGSGQSQTRI